MERYVFEMSELSAGKVKQWLRKKLQEHNNLNLISHNQCVTPVGKIRNTLIFEEPLAGLENQLRTMDSIITEDGDDAICETIS